MDIARPPVENTLQQIEFRAMGSGIFAAVQSDDPQAGALLAELPNWFAEWEQALSRFRESSELSLLNNTAGGPTPVAVSSTLWQVLDVALLAAHSTGGLVTPTVLNALEAAGYSASFDTMKGESPLPKTTHTSADKALPGWHDIEIYPETHSVRLPKGVRLDFGGIAKGWAADEAAKRLSRYGPALVNAGGDIAVCNPAHTAHTAHTAHMTYNWPIGVDAPLKETDAPDARVEQLALLDIRSGGVATSGRDYRRWKQGAKWQHHIIDPRTGLPSTGDVVSATIVAPTACTAEVSAKAAMLLGSVEGLAWIEARPTLAAILALENGTIIYSSRMKDYLWE